jgi:hypothetical protein
MIEIVIIGVVAAAGGFIGGVISSKRVHDVETRLRADLTALEGRAKADVLAVESRLRSSLDSLVHKL